MIGIVIAMKSEAVEILDGIFEWCSDIEEMSPVYIKQPEGEFGIIISGIGKVNAACATQMLIDRVPLAYSKIDRIINIGVCGATQAAAKQKMLAHIDSAVELDYNTSAIDGDEFDPNQETIENPRHRVDLFNILYTADHFTTVKPVLNGHILEGYFDMEGFAVAKVAHKNNLPVRLIKSVTDIIQEDDQICQYDVNFEKACGRLNRYLSKTLFKKKRKNHETL